MFLFRGRIRMLKPVDNVRKLICFWNFFNCSTQILTFWVFIWFLFDFYFVFYCMITVFSKFPFYIKNYSLKRFISRIIDCVIERIANIKLLSPASEFMNCTPSFEAFYPKNVFFSLTYRMQDVKLNINFGVGIFCAYLFT